MKYFKKHPNQKLALALIILGLFFGGSFWLYSQRSRFEEPLKDSELQKVEPQKVGPREAKVVYPIAEYKKRIQYRWFGKYVDSSDKVPDCGAVFTGFHNADDLEVTESEKAKDAPVYAVSSGRVRFAGNISGYGGLLIIEVARKGEPFLVSYGHVRLSSIKKKVGEKVERGEPVAVLGTGCSLETGGERKHLHFAVRKGNVVDYRGYVPNRTLLAGWVNPREFLVSLAQDK